MIHNPQPGARVRVIPAPWHDFGDCLGRVMERDGGSVLVALDENHGALWFRPDDLDPATVEATPAPVSPDGFEETLAVVKALRVFADEAKRRRPERAEAIEQTVLVAMAAVWRVYGLGDER